MLDWLAGPEVVRDDGAVVSWHNPAHPGYPYPEAAGLVLSVLALHGCAAERRHRIAARLARQVEDDAVGRDGRSYAFDLAVVCRGLLLHRDVGGDVPEAIVRRGLARLARALRERRPVWPESTDTRWSTRFGPHLLKAATVLIGCPEHHGVVVDVVEATIGLAQTRIDSLAVDRCAPRVGPVYLHAACYAAEGAWVLGAWGMLPDALRRACQDLAERFAASLASLQDARGALPAWYDGRPGSAIRPSDTVAQAVRLWSSIDLDRYRAHVDAGLAWLRRVSSPGGAVAYHETSGDLNTWATAFAVQAVEAARGAPLPVLI